MTSRAKAVPEIKIREAADISIVFIAAILGCLPHKPVWRARSFRRRAKMVKEPSTKLSVCV
jgi:hypothetical protein